jgi:hypothetical protein
MMDNPLGNLWILYMQNEMARMRGDPSDGAQWSNTFSAQPILPVPLTENWNLVTRPIVPLITAPEFELDAPAFGDCPGNCGSPPSGMPGSVGSSRETAWGDISGWSMLSPSQPSVLDDGAKFAWGLGAVARFPTATKDRFGSEKYTFGPAALALRQPSPDGRWTFGLLQQHYIWSFGGNPKRERVKSSQFQYIWWYKLPTKTPISIGATPIAEVNWQADSRDKWSIPLGIGASTTFFWGKMPVRLGAEFSWFVVSPDNYGKKFFFKLYLAPVIPRLIKKPIFGE